MGQLSERKLGNGGWCTSTTYDWKYTYSWLPSTLHSVPNKRKV